MSVFHPFLLALQFLTVLPVQIKDPPDGEATGRSLLYYPLVGLLIGGLLTTLAWAGSELPGNLQAATLLAFWVALTGMLHLDGLADSADAWIGGFGNRGKTLAIMKDPYCGPAAVVTLVLVLLLKFVALDHLMMSNDRDALVTAPILGRTALVLLFLTTPYVRCNGIGSRIADHLPRRACILVSLFTLAAIPFLIGYQAVWLFLSTGILFFALRTLMLRRIGGTTGDTSGALVEISETVTLFTAALIE
ncbi:MAG: adenosylcobinamide-GDP ribazoletransferase [Methylococcales bacterium]